MTDQELRGMIRESIARHLGAAPPGPEPSLRMHPSYGRLPLARGEDGDGACLIEPAVACNHCAYCVSYGH